MGWGRCRAISLLKSRFYWNFIKFYIMIQDGSGEGSGEGSGSRPWYEIANIDQLDTPALVVYPDRIKENIRRAIGMTGDAARLRPHVKTHKSPAVTRLMLEAGIRTFKCATIAEAEMLAIEGAPDVLLAYQPIGPKVVRLAAPCRPFPATEHNSTFLPIFIVLNSQQ